MIEKQSVSFHALRVMSSYPSQGRSRVDASAFLGAVVACQISLFQHPVRAKVVAEFDHWLQERVLYQKAAAEPRQARAIGISKCETRWIPIRCAWISILLCDSVSCTTDGRAGEIILCGARQARHWRSGLVAHLRHKAHKTPVASVSGRASMPVMPELQCYYYQAQLAVGDRREAHAGAASLWNVGCSRR